jgi:hypothetical protein
VTADEPNRFAERLREVRGEEELPLAVRQLIRRAVQAEVARQLAVRGGQGSAGVPAPEVATDEWPVF